jgi:hypothetical protein
MASGQDITMGSMLNASANQHLPDESDVDHEPDNNSDSGLDNNSDNGLDNEPESDSDSIAHPNRL